jgi:hypothetical protein
MTDEPTTPEPTEPTPVDPTVPAPTAPSPDAADELPGMPVPPAVDAPTTPLGSAGPNEPMSPIEPMPGEPTGRSRTWIWITAALVVVAVAIGAVVALSGGDSDTQTGEADTQTFSGHGVSFDYPGDWQALGPASFQVNSGDVAWSESFGVEAGSNGAIVTEYALKKDVSSVSEADLRTELDNLFNSTVDQAGGSITEPISSTTVNGTPGYRVSFTSTTGGVDLTTDMVLIFQGTQQWNIQCQYTADQQDTILPGCQDIWNSFTIGG